MYLLLSQGDNGCSLKGYASLSRRGSCLLETSAQSVLNGGAVPVTSNHEWIWAERASVSSGLKPSGSWSVFFLIFFHFFSWETKDLGLRRWESHKMEWVHFPKLFGRKGAYHTETPIALPLHVSPSLPSGCFPSTKFYAFPARWLVPLMKHWSRPPNSVKWDSLRSALPPTEPPFLP